MVSNAFTRVLLLAVTLLAVIHAAASFMCYTKEMGHESTSVEFCSTGVCYSRGGSLLDNKDSEKGCDDESHEDGCIEGGIQGLVSVHTCYCSSPLCNSAFTPGAALPMLILPVLLQRLFS